MSAVIPRLVSEHAPLLAPIFGQQQGIPTALLFGLNLQNRETIANKQIQQLSTKRLVLMASPSNVKQLGSEKGFLDKSYAYQFFVLLKKTSLCATMQLQNQT